MVLGAVFNEFMKILFMESSVAKLGLVGYEPATTDATLSSEDSAAFMAMH